MEEEYRILEGVLKDFTSKYVENVSMKIENEKIPEDVIEALAEQGYFSLVPPDGGETDMKAYSLVLRTIAKSSPSISLKLLLNNSFISLCAGNPAATEVSSGKKMGTVTFSDVILPKGQNGSLKMDGGKLIGEKNFVIGSDSEYIITILDSGELALVKGGFTRSKELRKLGFRSIGFSAVKFESNDFEILDKNGVEKMEKAYYDLSIPVASIALGMTEASISKAIEYAKVRAAFDHYLKDFQPLAFDISELSAQAELVSSYLSYLLGSKSSVKEALYVKETSLKLAKDASRSSLQVHGGYGYLEDFGIEKFYRDSMALSVLLHNEEKDMTKLSSEVFGDKAGFV
ncbi:MAG: acyl-CoA dehydrogenase family protein [Thermoplasmatales archaeon]